MPKDLEVPGGWTLSGEQLEEQIEWARETGHANCFMQLWMRENDEILTFVDLYDPGRPTKSITNDAEFVVSMGFKVHGDVPMIYRDTEGNWDELRHREGYFACFRALNTRDRDEAIEKVLQLHAEDAARYETKQ